MIEVYPTDQAPGRPDQRIASTVNVF